MIEVFSQLLFSRLCRWVKKSFTKTMQNQTARAIREIHTIESIIVAAVESVGNDVLLFYLTRTLTDFKKCFRSVNLILIEHRLNLFGCFGDG